MITAIPAEAQTTILTPGTSSDQLLFVYDARGNRVPFIAVTNFASDPIVVVTPVTNAGDRRPDVPRLFQSSEPFRSRGGRKWCHPGFSVMRAWGQLPSTSFR